MTPHKFKPIPGTLKCATCGQPYSICQNKEPIIERLPIYEPKHLKLWTMPANYAGQAWPDYYSAGVGQSRDSDCLEASNFAAMLALLGGESETVIVVRESHWAVGWVEWIAIHATDARALEIADKAHERLESYPVLDEEDWSQRETDAANTIWRDCLDKGERVKYIREHRSQFDFRDLGDLLGCVRGNYFSGYAGELING